MTAGSSMTTTAMTHAGSVGKSRSHRSYRYGCCNDDCFADVHFLLLGCYIRKTAVAGMIQA